ncbi:hypothetical protein FRC01_001930 [Tulasnella sp. 417]|nr:hypothetical protein FRC01_001930 [Tulasnella sp. 417]
MALRAIDPDYAPSSHNGIRFSNFGSKINGVKEAILLVLKDTDWPEHATNDVQALIQTMENLSVLNTLPKEENEIPDQPKIEIERLLRTLESVYTRLKHESENYSTRKKGFRKRVKSLFSRNNPSEITLVLRRCRNDVEHSSTALSELLRNLDIGEDSRSSPVFKAKAGDDAEILGGSHVALGAPSSDLDSGLGFGTAPVQSNNGPHRLAPQLDA